MKKRIFGLLLAVCLLVGLLPTVAFAATYYTVDENGVALVENENGLRAAISDGQTSIKLMADFQLANDAITLNDKEITLDLNGFYIVSSDYSRYKDVIVLEDTSAVGKTSLTLIDSRPEASHWTDTLPKGGLIRGKITVTVKSGGTNCQLIANGGSVTGSVGLQSVYASIYCTSDTPTVFYENVGRWGNIYGGIFRGQKADANIYGGIFYNQYINTDTDQNFNGKIYGGIFYGNNTIKNIAQDAMTVTYNNTNGDLYAREIVSTKSVNKANVAPIPPQATNTETGEHINWYQESATASYDFSTLVNEDITLTAKWENTYRITFDTAGGTEVDPAMLVVGTAVAVSEDPTKTGYTFKGWNPATVPMEDITVTAQWTANEYTITYEGMEGATYQGVLPTTHTYDTETAIPNPTKTSYIFEGWKINNGETLVKDLTLGAKDYTDNITLTAVWTYVPPIYSPIVNQPEEGGSVTLSPKYPTAGAKVTITATPDEGYEVDDVTVTDRNAKPVEVTDNGDGTYSFTQPASRVTIKVVFRDATVVPFVDVPADEYYYDAVRWAVKKGITEGTGDGTTFSPNAPCTRAQMAAFLWRAAGCPEPKSMSGFTDVSADTYYAKAVAWAVENGITDGVGDDKFAPDDVCTRSQMAAFLCRLAGGKAESGTIAFTDVSADAYYAEAVQWAVENGITDGVGDNKFAPDSVCTRGQMVTFLYRFFVK